MVEEEAVAVEKQSLAASAGGAAAAALELGAVATVRAPLAAERQLRPSIMWLGNDRMNRWEEEIKSSGSLTFLERK